MMSKFGKFLGTAAVLATLSVAATSAQATPYVTGSFAFDAPSTTTTAVTSTTQFLVASISTATPTPTGDFVGQVFPSILSSPGTIDFTTPGTEPTLAAFDWTAAGLGSFEANSVVFLGSGTLGGFAFVSYGVLGDFTVGSDWSNSGTVLSGSETWSCNQTNGAGNAIRCGGTFNAPASVTVPEPITLSLFGVGLAGAAAFRRRRRSQAVA
jgi:hypothetical protein